MKKDSIDNNLEENLEKLSRIKIQQSLIFISSKFSTKSMITKVLFSQGKKKIRIK